MDSLGKKAFAIHFTKVIYMEQIISVLITQYCSMLQSVVMFWLVLGDFSCCSFFSGYL